MATGDSIPVVDFEGVLSCKDLSTCPQVEQIHSAFTQVGFVFIKNHAIDQKLIEKVFVSAMDFFNLPLATKRRYKQQVGNELDTGNSGYVAMEQESVDPSQPGDLKEGFQVTPIAGKLFPDEELPTFKPIFLDLYRSAISLGMVLLEMMGHALQLKDPRLFVRTHQQCGRGENFTTCRTLHYPPLPPTLAIKPGQLRCGEHVDYGSITLLFQDTQGGLQVKRSDGGYIDVPYVPDVVLINLGILMQKWTNDIYLATPHRVLIPEEAKRKVGRQSLVVFLHPDHDTVVECVDGSGKYPPITAYQDTQQRLEASYDKSFQ